MKKFSMFALGLVLVLVTSGMAVALPYEYYSGYQSLDEGDSYFWKFDLAYDNDLFLPPIPGPATNSSLTLQNDEAIGFPALQSAFVKVVFYSTDADWEKAKVTLDIYTDGAGDFTVFDGTFNANSNFPEYTLIASLAGTALANWQAEEWGKVTIKAIWAIDGNYNDFGIKEVGIGVNPVPEPATMLLLGAGLLGLAGYSRRRLVK